MSETEDKKPSKKVEKKVAPAPKKAVKSGYEEGYLTLTALHEWDKATTEFFVEHPRDGKPTKIAITPGVRVKTWHTVYSRVKDCYHRKTMRKRANGEVYEDTSKRFVAEWEPID